MNKSLLDILRIVTGVVVIADTKGKVTQEMVLELLQASELVVGREIVDDKKFKAALKKTAEGVTALLNSSAWGK